MPSQNDEMTLQKDKEVLEGAIQELKLLLEKEGLPEKEGVRRLLDALEGLFPSRDARAFETDGKIAGHVRELRPLLGREGFGKVFALEVQEALRLVEARSSIKEGQKGDAMAKKGGIKAFFRRLFGKKEIMDFSKDDFEKEIGRGKARLEELKAELRGSNERYNALFNEARKNPDPTEKDLAAGELEILADHIESVKEAIRIMQDTIQITSLAFDQYVTRGLVEPSGDPNALQNVIRNVKTLRSFLNTTDALITAHAQNTEAAISTVQESVARRSEERRRNPRQRRDSIRASLEGGEIIENPAMPVSSGPSSANKEGE